MYKGRVSGRSPLRDCPRHISRRGIALLVGAIALLCSDSLAQSTTFVFEQAMSKLPVDVELTPNGALAIVRGNAPGTSAAEGLLVLDAGTGNKLFLNGCSPSVSGFGGFFKSKPSDFLRVTNSRAILVGGRDTDMDLLQDRTYIDVLAFDMSADPPSVSCLAHHELGSAGPAGLRAGWVNDVELTPDESVAIVNSQNWIHVVDMSTGSILQAHNIGSAPWAGPCYPGNVSGSVGVAIQLQRQTV